MERRFRLFVILASLSVVLIIGLQLFWLNNMYRDQQSRFKSDMQTIFAETMVGIQLKIAIQSDNDTMNKKLEGKLGKLIREGAGDFIVGHKGDYIKTATVEDTQLSRFARNEANIVINIDQEAQADKKLFDMYREGLRNAMRMHDITTPHEIAFTSGDGKRIYFATDSIAFRKMAAGTDDDHIFEIMISHSKNKKTVLKVVFGMVDLYLLKKMIWVIVISVVFILLFVFSFVYLLATFFRQKKMAEIRNDFINNMTHELKTPVSSVSVALELIAGSEATNEAKEEYISIAQGEIRRLTSLVEKVLNMAAFEKNEIRVHPQQVVLKDFLQNIKNTQKPLLERSNASIDISVLPETLTADIDKLHFENVFQNLLDNAIKYNDKAAPVIKINAWKENGHTMIQVADNGKGIPAAYIDKVFDKFFRVPAGDLHDVKGYGLGLSYVQAIVQLHYGIIMVESEQGSGTTFTIKMSA